MNLSGWNTNFKGVKMSRKKMIGIIIALLFGIIIAVIIAIVSPFKNTQIDVPAYLLYPRLHSSTNIENIYKSYLNIIFDAANLQEESIKEIKEKIAELPKDTYIYICVGRKLKKIIYTEETDRYGWNGVYSDESYNSVFIYWGTKPLGNVVDGYV